jgi:bifunctional non-homologous end joining protein LigD
VHAFSKRLSVILSRKYSGILTSDIRLDKRNGRIFVDYLRNAYAQTGVAPYAVRAKKGAPVAAPIDWHEIDSISSAQAFNIKNIFDRVRTKGDPWKDMISDPNSLKNARHLIS